MKIGSVYKDWNHKNHLGHSNDLFVCLGIERHVSRYVGKVTYRIIMYQIRTRKTLEFSTTYSQWFEEVTSESG